jgi:hypothetical protein
MVAMNRDLHFCDDHLIDFGKLVEMECIG